MKGLLKNTWKLLAILLVAYACISSFFLPMAPGIYTVQTTAVADSTLTLDVEGYNTHFTENNTLWLQGKDSNAVLPYNLVVQSDDRLSIEFYKQDFTITGSHNLWVHNQIDKTLFLPNVFFYDGEVGVKKAQNFDRANYIEPRSSFEIPYKSILYETIRNLNFHVCMWFVLLALMTLSLVYAVKSLSANAQEIWDLRSVQAAKIGVYFALLGIISGSIWAKYTWGAWWVNDPKLNGAALSTLVYLAYLVLRQSILDPEKTARISAVYNVFAYVLMIVFIQILPRLTDSLHPGNGGNPAFSQYDLDNNLRMIFYPATLGWILIGIWIWQISTRIQEIKNKYEKHA